LFNFRVFFLPRLPPDHVKKYINHDIILFPYGTARALVIPVTRPARSTHRREVTTSLVSSDVGRPTRADRLLYTTRVTVINKSNTCFRLLRRRRYDDGSFTTMKTRRRRPFSGHSPLGPLCARCILRDRRPARATCERAVRVVGKSRESSERITRTRFIVD